MHVMKLALMSYEVMMHVVFSRSLVLFGDGVTPPINHFVHNAKFDSLLCCHVVVPLERAFKSLLCLLHVLFRGLAVGDIDIGELSSDT